eukprot:jgi/Chrzof1/5715/Cz16g12240.t1
MAARGEVPPDVEEGSELALFIIDGECPRCGKVYRTGHRRHLETCKGLPEPPTEEEIQEQANSMKRIEKSRLRQLELGGLVDYDPDGEAVFIVVGSTGNHYVLRMDGSKRSCTCMDYRFRRHDCKHIKLILQQLKLQSSSDGDWRQAIEQQLNDLGKAGDEDVAMVQEADAVAEARKVKAEARKQQQQQQQQQEQVRTGFSTCCDHVWS